MRSGAAEGTSAGGSGGAPPLIQVTDLSRIYHTRRGEKVDALDGVSFGVYPGEFVSVVGPSGCGKSTLLNILAGLLTKTSGNVSLRDAPIHGPTRDVGMVFQGAVLLPWRTVLENALLPIEIHHLPVVAYAEKARKLLAEVGLQGFEEKYPFELSGGMQQRTSIVRALIHDPAVLLMDEPFGALDAMTRDQMNMLLQKLWLDTAKTVVFITHSIPEAVFLADRVIVMSPRPGRIVEILTVPFSRPRDFDLTTTAEFGELVRDIRHHLDQQPGA